jgi:hypothetical protein
MSLTRANSFFFLIVIALLAGSVFTPVHAQSTCTSDSQCPSGQTCVLISANGVCSGSLNSTNAGGGIGSTNAGGGTGNTGGATTLQNPLKFNSLPALMDAILQAIVQIGAILLTFMLVWVGFLFVMAQGNPEKLSAARSALIWTLIGGLILLGAEAISKVVEATVQSLSI